MRVGFIGLGAMGAAIAPRLLDAGHELVVFDVRAEAMEPLAQRGAVAASSPREVADLAELVLISLPTPTASLQVVDAVSAGEKIRVLAELSTIGEPTARRSAAALEAHGIQYIDAPISGGVRGAVDGSLTVMVAGEPAVVAEAMTILQGVGTNVVVVGTRPGQGQVVKLANNILSAAAIVASAEAVLLAVKAGIDPRIVIDVVSKSTGRNTAITDKFAQFVLPRTFNSRYRLDLIAKDVRLCLEAAGELGVPMFVGRQIEEMFSLAENQFGGDKDSLDVIRVLEGWSGVEIDDEAWREREKRS